MPFYKCTSSTVPVGIRHRKLGFLQDEVIYYESETAVSGATELTPQERAFLGDTAGCIAPWETKEAYDPTPEINEAVGKLKSLSFKYPDKVSKKLKDAVDLQTTEGLLSADGAPVEIVAPQGWKKNG